MKIYHNGRRVNGRFDSFKARVRRAVRLAVYGAVTLSILAAVFFIGAFTFSTSTVDASTKTVTAPIQAPVLDRIADCESGNGTPGSASHYKNGQVILRGNTNGTVDIGKYQVNLTYWGKKATELGLDLTKEADNKKMAEWLYANKGTGDWSSSAHCWNR